MISILLLVTVATAGALDMTCRSHINCLHGYWCNKGKCQNEYSYWCRGQCEPRKNPGERCKINYECEDFRCVPGPFGGKCGETCRMDSDCLRYIYGQSKYCTVGGTAGTQRGICEFKHPQGYRCSRSPECQGQMYCRNGQCGTITAGTEEVAICALNCHGPDPRKPDHIRPGHIVNITYSCTFIRRAEFGHQNLKAKITLNRNERLGKVSGVSPQYFSGFVTKRARKGEFTASLDAVMKPCTSNKDSCQANRKCILNAGQ